MTESPLVSVIMNCYNGEAYLRKAIDSIYAQTYPHWEIVFWDNCSTDTSPQIARNYDNRLHYLRGEVNVPLGRARSLAIAEARGDLICFLDTDDIWCPTKLKDQISAMADSSYSLCYGGVEEITEEGKHLRNMMPLLSSGYIFPELLMQFDINMVTPMLRLSTLRQQGLDFDPNIHGSEEYNLFMRLAARTPICVIEKILGKYRVRKKSLTNQIMHLWAKERYYTLHQIQAENPGLKEKYPKAFHLAEARGAYYKARAHMASKDKPKAKASLRPFIFTNFIYFVLYSSLFFPNIVWELIHRDNIKHGSLPKLFGFTR